MRLKLRSFTDYRLLADNPRSTVTPGPRYRDRPGEEPVARVVGIHNLALRAGVTEEMFEMFVHSARKQLGAYRSGARKDPQMSIMAKGLSDDDIADLAAWYSSLKVTVEMPK